MSDVKRIAVFGAGGLGRNMARLLGFKKEMRLVAMCDKGGYAFHPDGIDASDLDNIPPGESVASLQQVGVCAEDGMGELLKRALAIDPRGFELLVLRLLAAMGYGQSGTLEPTGRSGDGGIDGIISQDPLGNR